MAQDSSSHCMPKPSSPQSITSKTSLELPNRKRIHCSAALAKALVLLAVLLPLAPAKALEELLIKVPLSNTTLKVRLDELKSPQLLRHGTSDLAKLDRVSGGALGHLIRALLLQPVPLSIKQLAHTSEGSPLLEQAIFMMSWLGAVEGQSIDLNARTLTEALAHASSRKNATWLSLIQSIPGQRVILSFGRVRQITSRMTRQHKQADALIETALSTTGSSPSRIATNTGRAVVIHVVTVKVPHRSAPLKVTLVEPASGSKGRLVLVSHGLWDTPTYFQGWATLLASKGYTVALPRHPGSDIRQQHHVLAGQAPPPGPEELALRPKDLSAVVDAAASHVLGLSKPVATDRVVVLGHSWGGTTALQLAGVRPGDKKLLQHCSKVNEPARNLSWILQCSWLKGIQNSMISDPRVIAVGAVSPPVSLVFPRGSIAKLSGRVLLVSGSRDWVVPPDPEAISPMRRGRRPGNQLVLVKGGDHFNLRPGSNAQGGLLGPLLLAWTDAAFAAGPAVRPRIGASPLLKPQSWGTTDYPIVDVTRLLTHSIAPVELHRH